MLQKRSIGEIIFDNFNVIFLFFVMLITLYPLIFVAFGSISDPALFMRHRGLLFFPKGFDLGAYESIFKTRFMLNSYKNTVFVTFVGTAVNVVATSIAAYFLSRKNVFWKKYVMILIIITMFFNGGLIPYYLCVNALGLRDSLWVLIIPGAISTYNVIVMRTSFQSIPAELEESAFLDGAGHITVLVKIILPLSKAVIAVIALWYGVGHWNSWFQASIFINKRDMFPLQLILREILLKQDMALNELVVDYSAATDRQAVKQTVKYAASMVATIPILCVFPFLQKYFVKGVMIGALKG